MYKYKDILKALLEFYGNKEIIHTFSYYGDRMDSISFSAAQLIKSFHKIKKSIEESMQVEDDDVLYKYHLGNYLRTLNPERLHREIK